MFRHRICIKKNILNDVWKINVWILKTYIRKSCYYLHQGTNVCGKITKLKPSGHRLVKQVAILNFKTNEGWL